MPTDNSVNPNDHTSTQKTVDTATKGAAEAFAPGVGAKAYDMAKKTPIVGKQLDKATGKVAKKMDRIPGVQKATQKLDQSGVINAANQGINMMGMSPNMTGGSTETNSTQNGEIPSEISQTSTQSQKGVESSKSTPLFNRRKRLLSSTGISHDEKEDTEGTLETLGKIKKYKNYIVAGCAGIGCIGIIAIILFVIISFWYVGDLFKIDIDLHLTRINNSIASFVDNVANTFSGCWFQSAEDCKDNQEKKFFNQVKEVHDKYQQQPWNVKLDSALIVSTLTYKNIDNATNDDGEEYDIEDSINLMDASDYRKARKMINALADHMAPIYWETRIEIDEEGNEHEVKEKKRKLDLEAYNTYLKNTFLPNLLDGDEDTKPARVDRAIEEIYMRVDFYRALLDLEGLGSHSTVYAYCSGVTVVDNDGDIIGTYDLETYVAGVVSHEAYAGYPLAAYQAQAITARTYVLNYTRNCTQPIVNNDTAQAFTENIRSDAKEGAETTSGLVLVYNGSIFSTQYDSFCYEDKDCPDSHYDAATDSYIVTYTKMPAGEKHQISLDASYRNKFVPGGGHAHGNLFPYC